MLDVTSANPATMFASILIFLIIIGFVISMHEAAHAFAANRLGDPTARLLGRMSLNPASHIDPIGTILLPLILLIMHAPVFGWAKPTPINPFNFQYPRRDTAIVAFAGPASNFLLAIFLSLIFRLAPVTIASSFLLNFIVINLILGIFNLIPIPPLDGFKILVGVLPKEAAAQVSLLESYGPILLLVVLLLLLPILSPIIFLVLNLLLGILTGVTI
ncbi:MAG: hypothetical protein A2172_02500 [Candidatus Woykebacteria bacterium RBG_13_40_15]|uniref:Peptidase M50 domain-containing protein n=1 Tax=Candidatus Woykebacteria bacterium RBG_13_40_15 TaxID=1802593 RepID=A0A1G1W7E3_9BACT|nr:MAG: hypothetical protein A2172_02500 [Candidatus Woykebacteria bacterium RBG_13_40_15]